MTAYENQSRWMSKVSDSTLLSELTLPGTHDTMAWQYSSWEDISICHEKGLMAQLQCGARFLDLRLCWVQKGTNDANFSLHHSGDYQNAYFDGLTDHSENPECTSFVLDTCAEFLELNPSECIVVTLKRESSSKSASKYGDAFHDIFAKRPRKLFYAEGVVPALKDVRGKIVLITLNELDFENASTPLFTDQRVDKYGMFWGSLEYDGTQPAGQTPRTVPLSVENHWQEYYPSDKQKYVKTNLDAALVDTQGRWFVTYTSASQFARKSTYPKKYADEMNPWLEAYFKANAAQAVKRKKLGTLLMDYPTQGNMKRLIEFAQKAHPGSFKVTTFTTPWLYDAYPGDVDLKLRDVEENGIRLANNASVKKVEVMSQDDYGLVNLRLLDAKGSPITPWGTSHSHSGLGDGWVSPDFDGKRKDSGSKATAIDGFQFRYRGDHYLSDLRVSRNRVWSPWLCGAKWDGVKTTKLTTSMRTGRRRLRWLAVRRQAKKGLVDAQTGYDILP
jgi:1-phosphatidylinositol phosphodiesterase